MLISFFPIFQNFVRRLSFQSIRFLVRFACAPWRILLAISRRSFCCALFVLCVFTFLALLLFLLILALSVSPRSPSRTLFKNALSFFLRDLITRASSSSSSASSSGVSSSASSAPSSSSSFRAHGVRGVVASWAFSHNASLSSTLRLLIGLLLFSLPFTSPMCSSPLLVVLV